MRSRSSTLLWLAGAALLGSWLLVFVLAATALGSCGSDCGDNGGRAAFISVVASAPLGSLGLTLVVLGAGEAKGLVKLLSRLAIAGAALLALIALVVAVHAVDQLLGSLTGSDLHWIGQEGHERARMRRDAAASGLVVIALLPIAASGLLPALASRSAGAARRWAPRVLVALVAVYLAAGVSAALSADVGLPYALLGLLTALGAGLAFSELRRPPY